MYVSFVFFFECDCDHRDLHVLTHSFPTRRSSDLAVYQLLVALALFKIRGFLEEGLRLRTACDLECEVVEAQRPKSFVLPEWNVLKAALPSLIEAASKDVESLTTTVKYASEGKKKKEIGRAHV